MATFNQQGQTVHGEQYNSGGDMNVRKGNTVKIGDMGNNFSGQIAGGDITIQHGIPAATPADQKAELERLLAQLKAELEQAKASNPEEAETVAEFADELLAEADKDSPRKTTLQIKGESLKAAAQTLADITPNVVSIATQLVAGVLKALG